MNIGDVAELWFWMWTAAMFLLGFIAAVVLLTFRDL